MKRIFGTKRVVVMVTAVAMLIAAASAYAAINSYTGVYSFTSKKAGTAKKPVAIGFTQNLKVTPGTSTNRAGVLLDIKSTIYGLKIDGKDFPTCPLAKIAAAHNDTVCPKGALVATGGITAVLGPATNFATSAGATPCDPGLDVWNGGQGKLVFFFVENAQHVCLGGNLKTGAVAPYPATYKTVGKNLVMDTPIPKAVDYPVPGLVGSLQSETLKYKSQTSKGHSSIASVACQGSKRPYMTSFTATLPGQSAETAMVMGSAPCSK